LSGQDVLIQDPDAAILRQLSQAQPGAVTITVKEGVVFRVPPLGKRKEPLFLKSFTVTNGEDSPLRITSALIVDGAEIKAASAAELRQLLVSVTTPTPMPQAKLSINVILPALGLLNGEVGIGNAVALHLFKKVMFRFVRKQAAREEAATGTKPDLTALRLHVENSSPGEVMRYVDSNCRAFFLEQLERELTLDSPQMSASDVNFREKLWTLCLELSKRNESFSQWLGKIHRPEKLSVVVEDTPGTVSGKHTSFAAIRTALDSGTPAQQEQALAHLEMLGPTQGVAAGRDVANYEALGDLLGLLKEYHKHGAKTTAGGLVTKPVAQALSRLKTLDRSRLIERLSACKKKADTASTDKGGVNYQPGAKGPGNQPPAG
jgi:hypothetical protein